MSFTPSSSGSPILSPTRLNTQFPQIRSTIRSSAVRKWLPLVAGICLLLTFIQLGLVGGRSGGEQQQHVQSVQHIHINSPSTPGSSYQYNSGGASIRQSNVPRRKDFPPKIWQTWKVDPLRFEERDLEKARSWTEKNPDWRYEVLTDGNDLRYVEFHYGPEGFNRPDIVAFYRDVTAAIIKADLLRYLVMYAEGGIYADIDVEAMKPMSKFIPERYDHADIDMVIGIEIDEPEWKDHPILGPKSRSFCQWTFMCKPQLPVMLRLVENIMGWLEGVAQNQTVPIGEIVLDFDSVISGTGPSAFTRAILQQMNEDRMLAAAADPNASSRQGSEITWDAFHDMDESKVVERVLVLNVEAFAAGQGHSDSGTHDTRHSLVRHHYHASNWPSRHPRYKHPAYGQVEDCNWNKDCVHRWDDDVAAFEKLSPEEQQRIISEKEKEREEKLAEEERQKEEDEARRREDEERRAREDEERRAKEEGDRKAEDGEREEEEKKRVPLPAPSGFFSNAFGYVFFVVAMVMVLKWNDCLTRKPAPNQLPVTEKV